jgi:hypothetical protein
VRWLAIAAACIPGIPALLLVILALGTHTLELEESLAVFSIPFVLAPLAAYGVWTLSRHQGGKLSFGTSLFLVGLTVFAAFASVPVFLFGVVAAALGQDKTGVLVMAIAVLVAIVTAMANVLLLLILITNRR